MRAAEQLFGNPEEVVWLPHRHAGSMVVAIALLGLTACGGPPRAARVALEETAGGLDVADERLADAVERNGEESRAQVRREARAGELGGETRAETIDAGLERFEELMAPTTAARAALRASRVVLEAIQAGLDAWEAGADEGLSFFAAAACAVVPLAEVAAALEAAEVEVPDAIVSGVQAIAGFAASACPEGE